MNQTTLTVEQIVSTLKSFNSQERQKFLTAIADFDELWEEIQDVSGTLSLKTESAQLYDDIVSFRYTVALERNEVDGYTVTVPALPGCITQGDNIADALSNAKEAIECHLESMAIDKELFPPDLHEAKISLAETDEILLFKISVEPEVSIATTT